MYSFALIKARSFSSILLFKPSKAPSLPNSLIRSFIPLSAASYSLALLELIFKLRLFALSIFFEASSSAFDFIYSETAGSCLPISDLLTSSNNDLRLMTSSPIVVETSFVLVNKLSSKLTVERFVVFSILC